MNKPEAFMEKSIAIIIPAHNEEQTIAGTLKDFYSVCPDAVFYVVDNASKDETRKIAEATYLELGCKGRILSEPRRGKALAVRKAFIEVNADIYVMVDADLTYPASDLPKLLQPVLDGVRRRGVWKPPHLGRLPKGKQTSNA